MCSSSTSKSVIHPPTHHLVHPSVQFQPPTINIRSFPAYIHLCRLAIIRSSFDPPCIHPSFYPSVHPSVHPSIRPSVRPSVRPSIHPSIPPSHPPIHPP